MKNKIYVLVALFVFLGNIEATYSINLKNDTSRNNWTTNACNMVRTK